MNYLYFNYVIPLLKYVLQPLNAKSVINSAFFLRENIKFNNKDRCPPYLPFYEHLQIGRLIGGKISLISILTKLVFSHTDLKLISVSVECRQEFIRSSVVVSAELVIVV